jgi:putative ABC transport system permease protein
MIKNYFTQTIRSLSMNKSYFLINLLGLTVGISSFVLIGFWAFNELSYDRFHNDHENIYRVNYKLYEEDVLELHSAAAVPAIGSLLLQRYPEVVEFTRFTKRESVIRHEDIYFKETSVFFADSNFFSMFSFPLVTAQDPDNILAVNSVVISESAAQRYFGTSNPIGKAVTINGGDRYFVSAIAKDVPDNSHFKFDFLFSYQNLLNQTNWYNTGWFGPHFYTYVRLSPNANPKDVERKIPNIVEEHLGDFMREAWFLAEFDLVNLTDIHLNSNLQNELAINGSAQKVKYMTMISVLILLIAFINYINLSTSRSVERATEVGVRKVLGARSKDLIGQFLSEAVVFTFLASVAAFLVVLVVYPIFGHLMGSTVWVPWELLPVFFIILFAFSSIFTGVIPALYLSGVSPSLFIRGKGKVTTKGMSRLRNSLVVVQFAISMILIVGTFIINKQLSFMSKQDLGIGISQRIVLEGPKTVNPESSSSVFEAFREEIMQLPYVDQVSISTNVPGEEVTDQPVYGKKVEGVNTEKNIRMIGIDQHFIDTYGLTLIAGRNFDKPFTREIKNVIINEAAVKYLELGSAEEAIGQELTSNRGEAVVIGVVNDYNQKSLRELPCPLVFSNRAWGNYITIKGNKSNLQELISTVDRQWQAKFTGNPLHYFFLEDYLQDQYKADHRSADMFVLFSMLAIFIACLGLLGLSAFNTSKRIKKIGVRKVTGATVFEIILILNRDFLQKVAIAFVFATPIAWYAMDKWLQNFAYRTVMNWWIFAMAGIIALGIAVLTVSFQSWKAATRNPVEALRYE